MTGGKGKEWMRGPAGTGYSSGVPVPEEQDLEGQVRLQNWSFLLGDQDLSWSQMPEGQLGTHGPEGMCLGQHPGLAWLSWNLLSLQPGKCGA